MKTSLSQEQEAFCRRTFEAISHELRTPLANLWGRLEAMEDGLWPSDSIHLAECIADVERLTRFVERIEGLMDEDKSLRLPASSIRLDKLMEHLCSSVEKDFQLQGVTLKWTCDQILCRGEEIKLETALNELLLNALQYTPPGGKVVVQGENLILEGRHWIQIQVTDTGCGISPEDLSHLFELFYRADRSRCSTTGGAGLGLAICQNIVHQHGGSIQVESCQGKGTEFRIILPQQPMQETSL